MYMRVDVCACVLRVVRVDSVYAFCIGARFRRALCVSGERKRETDRHFSFFFFLNFS